MEMLGDFLPFVKDQADFHEKQALKYRTDPKRQKLHNLTAQKFKQLSAAIESALRDFEARAVHTPLAETLSSDDAASARALNITPADLAGLPKADGRGDARRWRAATSVRSAPIL